MGASTIYGHCGFEGGNGGVGDLIKTLVNTGPASDPITRLSEVQIRARPTQVVSSMIDSFEHLSEEYTLVPGRNIVYAQLGGYDLVIPRDKTEPKLSIVQFASYAGQFIERVKKDDLERGTPLILGTSAGIDDERAEEYYQQTGERFTNVGRIACNEVIMELAQQHNVPVIDNYRLLGGAHIARLGYLSTDLVHPNGRGHRLMAAVLAQAVRTILTQQRPLYTT